MKQLDDKFTGDLLDGFKRSVGRPRSAKAMSAADRQRLRRERIRQAGRGYLTVELPLDLVQGLQEFVKFKDVSESQVIERLLRGQLLRKR